MTIRIAPIDPNDLPLGHAPVWQLSLPLPGMYREHVGHQQTMFGTDSTATRPTKLTDSERIPLFQEPTR
jgi:hypothetical protein